MSAETGKLIVGTFPVSSEAEIAEKPPCRHRNYVLHEESRTVTCGACDSLLDAFGILEEHAREERTFEHSDKKRREAEARTREAEKRLLAIKEEERKMKARLRKAARQDVDTALAEERVRQSIREQHAEFHLSQIIAAAQKVSRMIGRAEKRWQPHVLHVDLKDVSAATATAQVEPPKEV